MLTPILFFDGDAQQAATYYAKVFHYDQLIMEHYRDFDPRAQETIVPLTEEDKKRISYCVLRSADASNTLVLADRVASDGVSYNNQIECTMALELPTATDVNTLVARMLRDEKTQVIIPTHQDKYSDSSAVMMDPFGIQWYFFSGERLGFSTNPDSQSSCPRQG